MRAFFSHVARRNLEFRQAGVKFSCSHWAMPIFDRAIICVSPGMGLLKKIEMQRSATKVLQ
jgi:hypothetical protein